MGLRVRWGESLQSGPLKHRGRQSDTQQERRSWQTVHPGHTLGDRNGGLLPYGQSCSSPFTLPLPSRQWQLPLTEGLLAASGGGSPDVSWVQRLIAPGVEGCKGERQAEAGAGRTSSCHPGGICTSRPSSVCPHQHPPSWLPAP